MALDPAVGWIHALVLGGLLGTAAWHKLGDLPRFRSVLTGYGLLPPALVPAASVAVIMAEGVATLALLVPAGRAVGGVMAAGLLAAYGLALAINLLRGRTRIDCGCLGFGRQERISWWLVARNIGLAALALLSVGPTSDRRLTGLDVLTIAGTAATIALLAVALTRLTDPRLSQKGAS